MKNYAKIGKQKGKPAYRTPSRFIARRALQIKSRPLRRWHLAARLDRKGRQR